MGILSNFMNLNRYEILARIVIILLVLPLHEFAHGWVARKCGDDTAEAAGRLTLNPLAHVDPFGAVLLLLTGFGWAKPVPINPARMNHSPQGHHLDITGGAAVQSAGGTGGRSADADRLSVLLCRPQRRFDRHLYAAVLVRGDQHFAGSVQPDSCAAAGRLQNFGNGASRQIGFCIPQFQLPLQFPSFTVPGFQRHDRTDY